MIENPVTSDRTRHGSIDVEIHFLHERVRASEIKLYKFWVPLHLADALTKSLRRPSVHKHTPCMYGTRFPYRPFADPGA